MPDAKTSGFFSFHMRFEHVRYFRICLVVCEQSVICKRPRLMNRILHAH